MFGSGKLATIGGVGNQAHLGFSLNINPNSILLFIIRCYGLAKIDGDIQTQANNKLANIGGPRSLA